MISRTLTKFLQERFFKRKAIVLVGARQVGKTTLLNALAAANTSKTLFLNCDEPDIRERFLLPNSAQLRALVGENEIIFIDEAQRVKDIGITLKLLIDLFPTRQIVVSGSSALELSNRINEPLTGRKFDFRLFPLSTAELVAHTDALTETRLLEHRLIYGMYPDVVNNPGMERELLGNLASSYLYKDIFVFQDIRKPEIIERLLRALALQVGQEVSNSELAQLLGIDVLTVRRYMDLLEKAFIIFHLSSFSRNVRNELKKSQKIYFYDNGIRNALIANFTPLPLREDTGRLWENFLISERIKQNQNLLRNAKSYFWRTTQQQEIDYIEEKDGVLSAFEFKKKAGKRANCPATFSNNYPGTAFTVITQENYMEFLM
jgi:predicted AAA+ superfamily ATPase